MHLYAWCFPILFAESPSKLNAYLTRRYSLKCWPVRFTYTAPSLIRPVPYKWGFTVCTWSVYYSLPITKLTVISTQTIHIILVHDTVVHVYQIRVWYTYCAATPEACMSCTNIPNSPLCSLLSPTTLNPKLVFSALYNWIVSTCKSHIMRG